MKALDPSTKLSTSVAEATALPTSTCQRHLFPSAKSPTLLSHNLVLPIGPLSAAGQA